MSESEKLDSSDEDEAESESSEPSWLSSTAHSLALKAAIIAAR